jgi:hypothetical protein
MQQYLPSLFFQVNILIVLFNQISTRRLRARLVRCNGYYTVIEMSITMNKRSCNVITITIYLFGDNT